MDRHIAIIFEKTDYVFSTRSGKGGQESNIFEKTDKLVVCEIRLINHLEKGR